MTYINEKDQYIVRSKEEQVLEIENKISDIPNNPQKFIDDKKDFFDKQLIAFSGNKKEPTNSNNTTFYYFYQNLKNEIEINPQKFIYEEIIKLQDIKYKLENQKTEEEYSSDMQKLYNLGYSE